MNTIIKHGLILVASVTALSACHPQETSSPVDSKTEVVEKNEVVENTANTTDSAAQEVKQETKEVKMPQVDSKWSFFYQDRRTPELLANYKKALKIVVDQANMHGTMENVSRRLGDWYVIGIDDGIREDPRNLPTDAPMIDHVHTYVVDLANEKLIEQNDFAALRPLFDGLDLVHRQPLDSLSDEKSFLNSLAALVASVADKHWKYVEPIQGQRFPPGVGGPRLEIKGDTAIFTYFVSGSGMMMSYTQNQLTITPSAITFNSELYRMPR